MKLAYPNEPRFSEDQFGDCPIALVEQALKAIEQRDLQVADHHALPIALVGQLFAASKGVKDATVEQFNPYQTLLYRQDAKATLFPEVAQTFLRLTSQKRVPSWVVEIVDLKLIRSAAS